MGLCKSMQRLRHVNHDGQCMLPEAWLLVAEPQANRPANICHDVCYPAIALQKVPVLYLPSMSNIMLLVQMYQLGGDTKPGPTSSIMTRHVQVALQSCSLQGPQHLQAQSVAIAASDILTHGQILCLISRSTCQAEVKGTL